MADKTITITFIVTNAETSSPIEGATVKLEKIKASSPDWSWPNTITKTDSDGQVTFTFTRSEDNTLVGDYEIAYKGFVNATGKVSQPFTGGDATFQIILHEKKTSSCKDDSDCGTGLCCDDGKCVHCTTTTNIDTTLFIILTIAIIAIVFLFIVHIL